MALPAALLGSLGRLGAGAAFRGLSRRGGGASGASGAAMAPIISYDVVGEEHVARTLSQIGPREARNLMRSVVRALAQDVRKGAIKNMTWTRGYSTGATKRGTKLRQRKIRDGQVQFDIVVQGAFWWRFHEYGQGVPERAMFGRSLHRIRHQVGPMFDRLFLKKWEAAMARQRRRGQ